MLRLPDKFKTLARGAALAGALGAASVGGVALTTSPALAQHHGGGFHGGGGGFHGGGGGFHGRGFHGGGFHGGAMGGDFRGSGYAGGFHGGGYSGYAHGGHGHFRGGYWHGQWYGPDWDGWAIYGYPYDYGYYDGCDYWDYYYGYCY
ncbi:MAG TPA: hypothetical protein VMU22_14035 [Rhizomicrobium sp.]|nr:hypothetical protein [Rhizomicrobium sp.]